VNNITTNNECGIRDSNNANLYNIISENTVTGNIKYGITSCGNNITRNTIANNDGGIYSEIGRDYIKDNLIYGNRTWGINSPSITVLDATYNWWGDNSGPTHASNPGGRGDPVSDHVIFDPWTGKQGPPVSIVSATGTGRVTFSSDAGDITDLSASLIGDFPAAGCPYGRYFTYGLFSFHINNVKPGSTVTVTIIFPSTVPLDAQYWKYQNGGWLQIPISGGQGSNTITIKLTDGGSGDADRIADGTIIDPGGPAVLSEASTFARFPVSESTQAPERLMLLPARMTVQNLNVQPQQAQANQPVTIYANIINRGETPAVYTANLKINGKIEQTMTGNLGGNSVQRLEFTVYPGNPGTYIVDINGTTTNFSVLDNGKRNNSNNIATIIIIALAVLVVIVAALVIRQRIA
jgi:hypothetical protein